MKIEKKNTGKTYLMLKIINICFYLIFTLFLTARALYAQAFTNEIKLIKNNYLHIATKEVTNEDYLLFLTHTKHLNKKNYRALLPDTTVWRQENRYSETQVEYYFRHPAYAKHPVVGVTKKQAIAYCEWMEDQINMTDTSKTIIVRLPSLKEWEYVASYTGHFKTYPWKGRKLRDEKGKLKANFMLGMGDYMGIAGNSNDAADITAPVGSYAPTGFGIYDIAGNVAEMIADTMLVKGGSWASRANELKIKHNKKVTLPSSEVGFRYVVEVIDLKKKTDLILSKRHLKSLFKKFNDTLYVGKTEVTNELYNLFVQETSPSYSANCLGWINQFTYSNFYANNYYTLFEKHPVVNITKKQARLFCIWLERKYNYLFNEEVKIRLPLYEERLLFAVKPGSNYPWKENSLRGLEMDYKANFNAKGTGKLTHQSYGFNFHELSDFDAYGITNSVKKKGSYDGLYGVAGNVTELIEDENIVMGGSWAEPSKHLQSTVAIPFSKNDFFSLCWV